MEETKEAEGLLRVCEGNFVPAMGVLERQLNALHMRGQVLIGFAAVAVTTTGFSGRLIAGTNLAAQICVIVGLAMVLLGCLWIFYKVMGVSWVITRQLVVEDPVACLAGMLIYRNQKTRAYRRGGGLVLAGIVIYAVAISIMLLNPEPLNVPVR